MILVAGDSFAGFIGNTYETYLTGDYNKRFSRDEYYPSLGELLADNYSDAISVSMPGTGVNISSFVAIKFLQTTDLNIDKMLFYVTDELRSQISIQSAEEKFKDYLCYIEADDFYKQVPFEFPFTDTVKYRDTKISMNLCQTHSQEYADLAFLPSHYHNVCGNLITLQTYCDKKNIDLIFVFVFENNYIITHLEQLGYDIKTFDIRPVFDKHNLSFKNHDRTGGNHIFEHEHKILYQEFIKQHPTWR